MESETLKQQAANNTKEQFGNSPDLNSELMNAVMDAQEAHTTMSTKALNSAAVLAGIKDILLNHSRLWEALRSHSCPRRALGIPSARPCCLPSQVVRRGCATEPGWTFPLKRGSSDSHSWPRRQISSARPARSKP